MKVNRKYITILGFAVAIVLMVSIVLFFTETPEHPGHYPQINNNIEE